MKKFLIISFLITSFLSNSYADHYIDSLKNELTKAPEASVEAEIKYKLADLYLYNNMDSSILLLTQAMKIADEEKDSSFFADAYDLAGYIAFHNAIFDTATYLFHKSFTFYDTVADFKRYLRTKIYLINCDILNYKLDAAFRQITEIEKNHRLTPFESIKIADLYFSIFNRKGDYESAYPLLISKLPLLDSVKRLEFHIQFYSNLGYTCNQLNKPDEALKYFLKSYEISKSMNSEYVTIVAGISLGNFYQLQKKWTKSIKYFEECSRYYQKVHNWTEYVLTQTRLVESYIQIGNMEKASECIQKADEKFEFVNREIVVLSYYKMKAKYYTKKNLYKKAYSYLKMHQSLQDSLYQLQSVEELNELRVQFQTEKKEQQNIILKQKLEIEKATKKRVLLSWLTTIAILIALIFIFFLYWRNIKHRRTLDKENTIRLEQENKLLESQKEISNQKLQAHKNILSSTNNSLLQQSQLTSILIEALKDIRPYSNKEGQNKINSYLADLSDFSKEKNWQTFEQNFILLYPNFLNILKQIYPSLTIAERKQCSFIKMDLSSSEISKITLQEKHSIYRLNKKIRDKIGVETNEELILLLKKIG